MIGAERFIDAARGLGFRLYAGVPCSYLKPFINYVIDAPSLRYLGAANEGDAVAIAAGAWLGGEPAVVMFQNSGLGNAVNVLTSLTHTFRIPVLLIPTLRGEPGGAPDEPQHELMGQITPAMLELMEIAWEYFPLDEEEIPAALERARVHMERERRPFALLMRKGSVASWELGSKPEPRPKPSGIGSAIPAEPQFSRGEMLRAVQAAVGPADILVATTGYTGRELYACEDRPGQLYMVGSMGCASSLGLGLAVAAPDRRIVVIDGDGAALMRLGALATLGYERPGNLLHIVLDNRAHESTGGQSTVSRAVDFAGIAAACGYPCTLRAASPDALGAAVRESSDELTFIHVPIRPGTPPDLPRPTIRPPEVALRLREFISGAGR